jgi:prolyl-tRNA synthetase
MVKTPTPGKSTCADVAELLGVPLATTVKSLVLATDELNERDEIVKSQVWLLLLRGDHDMNEVKVGKVPGLDLGFRFATEAEIEAHFGCKPGYLGPHRPEAAGQDRGRPRGGGDGRLDLWRQRGGLPH